MKQLDKETRVVLAKKAFYRAAKEEIPSSALQDVESLFDVLEEEYWIIEKNSEPGRIFTERDGIARLNTNTFRDYIDPIITERLNDAFRRANIFPGPDSSV